jgi:UDP-3-O-[3-hydroxymyristoyl] glucosamine N-acyltransferase
MKLSEIARLIGGVLEGSDVEIGGVSNLDEQRPGDVVYVEDKKYLQTLAQSDASALIIDKKLEYSGKPVIRVDNPKLAFAKLLETFDPCGKYPAKVYDNAHVEPTAKLGKDVTIMPFAAVMDDAVIGDGSVIYRTFLWAEARRSAGSAS